jgi:hypothetical protein
VILAIDPGTTHSAFVWYDAGRIISFGYVENARLATMLRQLEAHDAVVVIEMVQSFGMPVGREVFEMVVWIGRFMEAARHLPVDRITRTAVKTHLCHSVRAKDSNIRQALIDKLGQPGKKTSPGPTFGITGDEWAALAVAVTYHEMRLQAQEQCA